MRQRHPLRIVLALALVSMAGIVGQLLFDGALAVLSLGFMLVPLGAAAVSYARDRPAPRRAGFRNVG